ncbi:MAG: helix-turn-helix domain-containing protein [Betaproteobacteria bacterium]|nr:helix-turn-helix domain-containing protein [Betaproteobacteria bacterium]
MGRNINSVIAGLPKARRARIETKAVRLAREMIDHADSLVEIRKAMSKTQTEIARELGVGQVAVAQLEKRSDLLLSTLQRYVRAAGAELSLVIHTRQGAVIVLQSLGDLAGRKHGTTKLGRVTNARIIKGRAILAAVK